MTAHYKCPYCGQDSYKATGLPFNEWNAVRKHVSTCKKNINKYIICKNEGPISWDVINNCQSLQHLKSLYPKLSFSKDYWGEQRKNNKTSIRLKEYSNEELLSAIKTFHKENNRLPQSRDFKNNYLYPNDTTIEKRFGSWNNAIKEAGFEPNNQYGYGVNTIGIDGSLYRSQVEAYFANTQLYNKFQYEYEKPYGNGWYYDFYLPELNLYIEITAGLRPDRILEKIEFNKKLNRKFLVLRYEEIYKKDFSLQDTVSLDSHKIEGSDSTSG